MINVPRCIGQVGLQVFRFQIREVREDLLAALASGKELKDVLHNGSACHGCRACRRTDQGCG